ncbi:MAG: hypothetical protein M5U34_03055 [Chloroflexi bacterium]|nr:hypothetical protein [Chloroflexota bacterium]
MRDWPAYFQAWPQRGMVRFLYRANLRELADYVNENTALTDFGVSSLLAGPWDQLAFASHADNEAVRPRWFNAERAILLEPALSFSGYPETAAAYASLLQPVPESIRVG